MRPGLTATGCRIRWLLAAARRSLERTGGILTGRISVADPDDAERKAIIGITGVHQPAGTRRLTVSLEALDAAVSRGTGYGLVSLLTELGGPLRNRPVAAASLAASRAELVALAEASPLYLARDWYRQWLGELRQDGTLTRLATQGDVGILAHGVHVLEFLEGLPAGAGLAGAGPIALPALAAQITGDTKGAQSRDGTRHARPAGARPPGRRSPSRVRGRSGGTCGTGPGSWSMTWPAASWC